MFDNSNIKGNFLKFYHQQATNSTDSDQIFEFTYEEINIKHQIGNMYPQYEMTLLLQLIES